MLPAILRELPAPHTQCPAPCPRHVTEACGTAFVDLLFTVLCFRGRSRVSMLPAVVEAQEALISGIALHVFINLGGAHGYVCNDLLFSSRSAA